METEINEANLQKLINLGDNISFADLFTSEFLGEYTSFKTMDELFQKSGFTVETEEDFKEIPDKAWEDFIVKNSSFDSWKEMQIKAFEVFTDNILLS